ncbi:hypothetical protein R1flu_015350 [Riccia fluitans]|uniref:Uncharacterized protein n=1 Tax=Riccia fluitans TaxID=41844 RepID=A0ABD1YIQ3_9MARC
MCASSQGGGLSLVRVEAHRRTATGPTLVANPAEPNPAATSLRQHSSLDVEDAVPLGIETTGFNNPFPSEERTSTNRLTAYSSNRSLSSSSLISFLLQLD